MASLTSIQIANMALSFVGASGHITSFSDNSPEAEEANRFYNTARLMSLEAYDWHFARVRATLADSANAAPTDGEWEYRYDLPSNLVKMRYLVNPLGPKADPVPYTLEVDTDGVKTVLTNLDDAEIVYTYDLTDTGLYSYHFCLVVATLLGGFVAFPLTGDEKAYDRMFRQWMMMVRRGQAFDAREEKDAPPREAEWIRGRS